MGYSRTRTKTERLEECRSYIISEYMGNEEGSRSVSNLADEFNVSREYMTTHIRKWREAGLLEYKAKSPLGDDKDLICTLYDQGLGIRELARKWGVSHRAVNKALSKWGVLREQEQLQDAAPPKISLDDLKSHWIDITERTVLTVGRIPRFYLVPISGDNDGL